MNNLNLIYEYSLTNAAIFIIIPIDLVILRRLKIEREVGVPV